VPITTLSTRSTLASVGTSPNSSAHASWSSIKYITVQEARVHEFGETPVFDEGCSLYCFPSRRDMKAYDVTALDSTCTGWGD
jgi:hypothetical protein